MTSAAERHPSSLILTRLARESLTNAERETTSAHVSRCPRCQADLAETQAAREAFSRDVLPRTLRPVRERLTSRRGMIRFSWLTAPSLVVAASVVAVVLMLRPHNSAKPGADGQSPAVAVKGSATLRVFALTGGDVVPVTDGTVLRAGDRIRFVVEPAGLGYLMIASIDGAGKATIYYPYQGPQSAALGNGTSVELPGSIVLDDARGPERLYALFSMAPVRADLVAAALRAISGGGATAIRSARHLFPEGVTQSSVLIEKAAR